MRHSIRFRLQVWHGLMLALVLVAFGVTAYEAAWQDRLQRVDEELAAQVGEVMRVQGEGVRPPRWLSGGGPPPGGPPRQADGFVAEVREEIGFNIAALERRNRAVGREFYYLFLDQDGTIFARSTNAPAGVPFPGVRPGPALIPNTAAPVNWRTREDWREASRVLPLGDAVLVGRGLEVERAALRSRVWAFAGAGLVLLAAGLAVGWWLTGEALRPIADISAASSRIAGGDLSQRVVVEQAGSELGQLADVLNGTFARLEESFGRQARFSSDASHELRTPISVILSKTQTALSRERTPEEYQEALRVCQRAAKRMRGLTESLLELSRQDAGTETLVREPLDLAAVAGETLELLEPLAAERGVVLHRELSAAPVVGDAGRWGQVLANLVTNAMQFSAAGGVVTVRTFVDDDGAVLEVSDTGSGIAPEDLPHIFERFYRGDASRTGSGNSGLGLAIVRGIAEAHGGRVAVVSEVGQGSRFTVRLPGRQV